MRLPSLSRSHPGFFKVVVGTLVLHGFLSLEAFVDPNRSSVSAYNALLFGREYVGIVHGLLFLGVAYGLYGGFEIARVCLRFSAAFFSFLAASYFVLIFIHPGTTWVGAILYTFVAIVHVAAALEPAAMVPVHPGNRNA